MTEPEVTVNEDPVVVEVIEEVIEIAIVEDGATADTVETETIIVTVEVPGATGATGRSAYDEAVDQGFVGNEAAWLASLQGEDGVIGEDGADGLSAYQVAVANGFIGNEAAWLASLVSTVPGPKGDDGDTGPAGADAVQPDRKFASAVSGTGTLMYCGTAPDGSATSAAVWTITRFTLDAAGTLTATKTASDNPTSIWDNYASLTYP